MMAAQPNDARGVDKLIEQGARPQRLDAPFFYATTIQAAFASNDFSLTFSRPHPVVFHHDEGQVHGAGLEPVAIVGMSVHTAKDLAVVLNDIISRYESEYGEIETDFTHKRKAEKKAEK